MTTTTTATASSSAPHPPIIIKCAVVGDAASGKTALLETYLKNIWKINYLPYNIFFDVAYIP